MWWKGCECLLTPTHRRPAQNQHHLNRSQYRLRWESSHHPKTLLGWLTMCYSLVEISKSLGDCMNSLDELLNTFSTGQIACWAQPKLWHIPPTTGLGFVAFYPSFSVSRVSIRSRNETFSRLRQHDSYLQFTQPVRLFGANLLNLGCSLSRGGGIS